MINYLKDLTELEASLYNKSLKQWGSRLQSDLTIEECAELIHAICNYKRCKTYRTTSRKVLDEMADVYIMLDQLRVVFNNDTYLNQAVEKKLKRLQERLNEAAN